MKSIKLISSKSLTLASLVCFLIPFSIYVLWIYAFDVGATQAERVAIFRNYLPQFLNGRWSATLFSIVFCVLAFIFSSMNSKLSGKIWKMLNSIIQILSGLLLLLNLWSMM